MRTCILLLLLPAAAAAQGIVRVPSGFARVPYAGAPEQTRPAEPAAPAEPTVESAPTPVLEAAPVFDVEPWEPPTERRDLMVFNATLNLVDKIGGQIGYAGWMQIIGPYHIGLGASLNFNHRVADRFELERCLDDTLDPCSDSVMAAELIVAPAMLLLELDPVLVSVSLAELHLGLLFLHGTSESEYNERYPEQFFDYSTEMLSLGLGFKAGVYPLQFDENGFAGVRLGVVPYFFGVTSQLFMLEAVIGF